MLSGTRKGEDCLCLRGCLSFFKYWHEAYISEVKIPYKLHTHSKIATSMNRHMTSQFYHWKDRKRQRLLWGSSPQPCAPQVRLGAPLGKQLFLALFFWISSARVRWLSGRMTQRPVVVASLWLGVIETSILCLNSDKQHRPHCYAYRTTLTVGTVRL